MMPQVLLSLSFILSLCSALQPASSVHSRKAFLINCSVKSTTTAAAAALLTIIAPCVQPVLALDMDAFANSQLGSTKKLGDQSSSSNGNNPFEPQSLSADEGLCRYGAPSKATGEACVRAGIATKRTKSLDAFGNYDRGDYIRCKTYYEDTGVGYEKRVQCE